MPNDNESILLESSNVDQITTNTCDENGENQSELKETKIEKR